MEDIKRIGLFCGSFDPFHAGHKNILDKAKYLFDEVIVAVGINPTKIDFTITTLDAVIHARILGLKEAIPNESIDSYIGFLPDYVKTKITVQSNLRKIRYVTQFH